MGYAQRLVSRILEDERARGNRLADMKVYRDEPILRTGAELMADSARRRTRNEAVANRVARPAPADERIASPARSGVCRIPEDRGPRVELPEPLRQLREMERGLDAYLMPAGKAFVRQAEFAAAYEDDFPYEGEFRHYFPTYRCMTDEQLRGYFSWRTRVRHGDMRKTSLSFAFVHLYELINSIGPSGIVAPEDGHAALREFCGSYGAIDDRILRYAGVWQRDYAVYHGLEAQASPAELARQEALKALMDLDEGARAIGDDELFASLERLSSYRIGRSRLMGEEGPLLRAAACDCWRALADYYRSHRKKTLFLHLFGSFAPRPYAMFGTALFWPRAPHEDAERRLGPLELYVCKVGRWTCTSLHGSAAANREVGALLKTVDSKLRERLGSEHPLKEAALPKYAMRIIEKRIDALVAEREQRARIEAERRRITIDFSKLSGIRAEAALSCETLLVDEERETETSGDAAVRADAAARGASSTAANDCVAAEDRADAASGSRPPKEKAAGETAARADAPADGAAGTASDDHAEAIDRTATEGRDAGDAAAPPFSPAEASYLRLLLEGAPADERRAALQAAGISEAMMIDAVNEKALDELGDVILEEGADGPEILEDYIEDVRGIMAA